MYLSMSAHGAIHKAEPLEMRIVEPLREVAVVCHMYLGTRQLLIASIADEAAC